MPYKYCALRRLTFNARRIACCIVADYVNVFRRHVGNKRMYWRGLLFLLVFSVRWLTLRPRRRPIVLSSFFQFLPHDAGRENMDLRQGQIDLRAQAGHPHATKLRKSSSTDVDVRTRRSRLRARHDGRGGNCGGQLQRRPPLWRARSRVRRRADPGEVAQPLAISLQAPRRHACPTPRHVVCPCFEP